MLTRMCTGLSRTLQYTPCLQRLSFPIPVLNMHRVPLDLVDELRSVVTSLPFTELRFLTLSETGEPDMGATLQDRRHTTKEVMQGGEYTTILVSDDKEDELEEVRVVLSPRNHQPDDVVGMIRHLFSSWDRRGILQIVTEVWRYVGCVVIS